jgi:hypothetical protein
LVEVAVFMHERLRQGDGTGLSGLRPQSDRAEQSGLGAIRQVEVDTDVPV